MNTAWPGLVAPLLSSGSRHIVHKFLDGMAAGDSPSAVISEIKPLCERTICEFTIEGVVTGETAAESAFPEVADDEKNPQGNKTSFLATFLNLEEALPHPPPIPISYQD